MSTQEPDATRQTRAKLIAAGIHWFARKGFRAATYREIVQTTGVPPREAFLHFRNKGELHREVLDFILKHHSGPLLALVATLGDPLPGSRAEVERSLQTYLRAFMEQVVLQEPSGPLGRDSKKILLDELAFPTSEFKSCAFMHYRPALAYFSRCLQVLRPELPERTRGLLSLSVHDQILGFHTIFRNPPPMDPLDRGEACRKELIEAYTQFCLYGATGGPDLALL